MADQTGHRLALKEMDALREAGITSMQGLARALVSAACRRPGGGTVWTHTTVARLLARVGLGKTYVARCQSMTAG